MRRKVNWWLPDVLLASESNLAYNVRMPNKPKMRPKVCPQCGRDFMAPKNVTRFCSRACVSESRKVSADKFFVVGKVRSGDAVKRKLFELGWKNECAVCAMGDEWQGRHLTLELDHINGDRSDNRLENLRILCPNCHSQTDTFRYKNSENYKKKLASMS